MIKYFAFLSLVFICLPCHLCAEPPATISGALNTERWWYAIRAGILAHDVDNLWSGQQKEEGLDYNAEAVFNAEIKNLFSGVIRPNLGLSINDRGNTSKLYGGVLWEWTTKNYFFNTGVGIAWHNGELDTSDPEKKSLGSRLLFRIPLEAGITLAGPHRLAIMFDHVSTAYLANPNEGLDTLGLRYSYQFD